jgi:hypothetical protein
MDINESLLKGKVKEIKPFIFAAVIKNPYDRAMLFCRYQEYYESPFPEIRGNVFTIEEYMKVYTQNNNKLFFSYPNDWAGYNVPSGILNEANKKFKETAGPYDTIMSNIIEYCEKESLRRNNYEPHLWYLVGVDKFNSTVMDHEIAHGLYYTNMNYKVEMDYLTGDMLLKDQISLRKELIKMGYANDKCILYDEIQAFMATGSLGTWNKKLYDKYSPEYVRVFKSHYNPLSKKNETVQILQR